jgi:hypothetical protein
MAAKAAEPRFALFRSSAKREAGINRFPTSARAETAADE